MPSHPREPPLSKVEIIEKLATLPGWRLDRAQIRRLYRTDGWSVTLMLVNAIGFVAEAADHHPDLKVSWSSVEVALDTHSAGGITSKDFDLAQQIEQVALWRPAPGSSLTGTPRTFVRGDDSQRL